MTGVIATGKAELWIEHLPDDEDVNLGGVMNGDAMELFGHPIIENTSHQYSSLDFLSLDTCHTNDKPLWWLVLRWIKMLLLKVAASHRATSLLLVVAPLFVGTILGFWIGRWQAQHQRTHQMENLKESKSANQERPQLMQLTLIRVLAELVTTIWYRLGLILAFCIPQQMRKSIDAKATVIRNILSVRYNTNENEEHKNVPILNCGSHKETFILCDDSKDLNTTESTRESEARRHLKSATGASRECEVPIDQVPKHIAVIMDGNRRYGKSKYGSAAKGHWDGSSKLVEFAKWCLAEHISVLTVFAFSSENWNRDPTEIAALMQIFAKYCDELRIEAVQRNIKITVLSTDFDKIPRKVQVGIERMVKETQHCNGMIMNICLSYGGRGEILGATRNIVDDVLQGMLDPKKIDENTFEERLLTYNCGGDPDVLIRTSGEVRISNFLLWQLAYTEFFFVDKPWPAIEKNDLLQVIRTYAKGRIRRYGS